MPDHFARRSAAARALPDFDQALQAFLAAYPAYADTYRLDELRATEYRRLDDLGHVYLDYTGGGLYAESQIEQHLALLRHNVFGNPHSHNPTSLAMTELVERARAAVLAFFNAQPEEYVVIFTPNASGALKLVGESYPFGPGGHFVLAADDHNSVNGIREFARAKGAKVTYVPVAAPELRLDSAALQAALGQGEENRPKLFAYPAQSNFSGVKHPLDLIPRAQAQGWDVLLDAAAFAPTNRLDLSHWRPDFVSLSFYKIFGYPTGVGALLARRSALAKLARPWFAGGTIMIASVKANAHYLAAGEAGFEDGTINYLALPAVEIGLQHITSIGLETITTRVACLTGWLLDALTRLRHSNGAPMVRVHGPVNGEMRGGTVTINLYDPEGVALVANRVEQLAAEELISLRTGCFCNPGAGEITYAIPDAVMREMFVSAEGLHFQDMVAIMQARYGFSVSAIRISVGLASNFRDVYRLVRFVTGLRDRSAAEVGGVAAAVETARRQRDAA